MSEITNLSVQQLRHIADLKEKINSLELELSRILGGSAPSSAGRKVKRQYRISAAARARIAAAQKARWAKFKSTKKTGKAPAGKRRRFSAAARAKIAAAARARWAKAKASGKNKL